jgi:hypothetical protein
MSFEEEWILPKAIEHYRDEDVLGFVRTILPPSIAATISGPTEHRVIGVVFSTSDVAALSARLTELGELDWDWEGDLEPPSEGDRYSVAIELVHDEVTKLRIASNDDDNRAAWPLVFSIAASLSVDLDALIDAGPTLDIRKMS